MRAVRFIVPGSTRVNKEQREENERTVKKILCRGWGIKENKICLQSHLPAP